MNRRARFSSLRRSARIGDLRLDGTLSAKTGSPPTTKFGCGASARLTAIR